MRKYSQAFERLFRHFLVDSDTLIFFLTDAYFRVSQVQQLLRFFFFTALNINIDDCVIGIFACIADCFMDLFDCIVGCVEWIIAGTSAQKSTYIFD